jgi:hypothetical protein
MIFNYNFEIKRSTEICMVAPAKNRFRSFETKPKNIANSPQCAQIGNYTGIISVLFSLNLKQHNISGINIVTKKILIHDILGLMNKSIIPDNCGFPLTNLHFAESVDVVPYVAHCDIL